MNKHYIIRVFFYWLWSILLCNVCTIYALDHTMVLRRAFYGEPESLDPQKVRSNMAINIVNDLFEGLVVRDPHSNIVPAQATRWEVNANFTEYTFHLRKSYWSDGVPLTAQDFVYGWKRAVTPAVASPYGWYLKTMGVQHADAILHGRMSPETLGIKAVDKHTLRVFLNRSNAMFIEQLVQPILFPVPEHIIKKYGAAWTNPSHIVVNGAYKMKKWSVNNDIVLVKKPAYWDNKHVKIPEVIWVSFTSPHAALKRFQAKEIDITGDLPTDNFKALQKKYAHELFYLQESGTEYLVFNIRRAPFNDVRLRRALSYAIDRETLVRYVLGQGQIPAYQFTPTFMKPALLLTPQKIDKEDRRKRAQEWYQEAGFSSNHPLQVTLLYNTSDTRKKLLLAIASMWHQVLGVKVHLENVEWKTMLSYVNQGKFDIARASWVADYNEASSMLIPFSSEGQNKAKYHSVEYDQWYEKLYHAASSKQKRAIYTKLETILARDMPIIPLYFYVSPRLVADRVQGYYSSAIDRVYTRYLWLND